MILHPWRRRVLWSHNRDKNPLTIIYKFCKCFCAVWCMSHFVQHLTFAYISAKNKDNDTKLSECDPWGLPCTSRKSWMIISSMSLIRNLQCLQVPPFLTTPLLDTLPIKISTQKFQDIFEQEPSTFSKYPPSWNPPSQHISS